MLIAALLAILGAFFGQRVRFRWSWTDLAVYGLFAMVALSARQGAEARVAINLAWEWVGVGLAYALMRHLPRHDGETSALAASLAATAVALAAFGFYQVGVVQPETQRLYRQNPEVALRLAGVANDAVSRKHFEDRLLGSKEPTATFALANSLAGFLVGPAVLILALGAARLADRERRQGRWIALLLAAPPTLLVLGCLLLTKSRSAWVGLAVAILVLAWRERRRVSPRLAIGAGVGLLALISLLVVVGSVTGQLDWLVLTQSTKSLRYRWEYWVGTWRVLWDGPTRWWFGLGPGNFAGPYLRNKLVEASEGISDPHNLLLEVWVTAGLPALLALLAAIGLGFRDLLGPVRMPEATDRRRDRRKPESDGEPDQRDAAPPARAGWLVVVAGLGGWLLAMVLRPDLSPFAQSFNPFEGDLMRWLVLGGAWVWAVMMGLPLWSGTRLPAWAAGAGVLAVLVNLLAAGGIGFAPVALALWGLVAIGLNLRSDRPCARLRSLDGWLGSFGLAAVWAAVGGTFLGTVRPHWVAESALERAEVAMGHARLAYEQALRTQPTDAPDTLRAAAAFQVARPYYEQAESAYKEATEADRYASRPWIGRGLLEMEAWQAEGEPVSPDRIVWHRINSALQKAATPPRNPDNLDVQRLRAGLAEHVLNKSGWPDFEHRTIQADRLDALRRAVRLHPTDARLRAELARALANAGLASEAADAAQAALRLDALIPHKEKNLPPDVRRSLRSRLNAPAAGSTRRSPQH